MNINKLIIPLQILVLSPTFPSLLAFILLIIYKIFFDPAMLCDDGCTPLLLEQLKQNLREEMVKSDTITHNITEFNKIVKEIKESSGELTTAQKSYNYNKLSK